MGIAERHRSMMLTVERAFEDMAFVDGVKHGFPGGTVYDASTTLTVSTTNGEEWSQESGIGEALRRRLGVFR